MAAATPTVGWIGTGRMGYQLALRMLNAGYDVAAYNRTRAKCEPLTEFGAKIVDSPADLADREIVFIMVSADKDLEAVVSGPGGLLTGEDKPKIVVDSSTVSPEASARVRAVVEDAGSRFVAAPVSGNPSVIAAGKLTVAASGPRSSFDEVGAAVLAAWGFAGTRHLRRREGEARPAGEDRVTTSFLGVRHPVPRRDRQSRARRARRRLAVLVPRVPQRVPYSGSAFSRYKSPEGYVCQPGLPPDRSPACCSARTCSLGLSVLDSELENVPMPLAAATDMLVAQLIGAGYTEDDFATLVLEQARRSGYQIEPENVPVDDGLAPEEA